MRKRLGFLAAKQLFLKANISPIASYQSLRLTWLPDWFPANPDCQHWKGVYSQAEEIR